MATLTITVAANANAGAAYRRLALQIIKAIGDMPDNPSTGASHVLTIDNGTGVATVQVTAGPYAGALFPV